MNTDALTPKNFREDKTGRAKFAEMLFRYLLSSRHSVSGSFVATLNAPYGSGKSVFLDLFTTMIKEGQDQPNPLPPVTIIRINAWEGDYIGNPVIQLVSEIYDALNSKWEANSKTYFKKITAALMTSSGSTFKGLLKNKFGEDATDDLIQLINSIRAFEDASSDAIFDKVRESYTSQRSAMSDISTFLTKKYANHHTPILIIVDELDRCKPDYAVHFLETLKHLFDVKGLIFLLAADLVSLESTVTKMFGNAIVFREYYRKFSHNTLELPKPINDKDQSLLREQLIVYLDSYVKSSVNGDIVNHNRSVVLAHVPLIFDVKKYTLRQMHHFLRVFMFSLLSIERSRPFKMKRDEVSLIAMLCLIYTSDENLFKELKLGRSNTSRIIEAFQESSLKLSSNTEWRALALAIGSMHDWRNPPPMNYHNLFKMNNSDEKSICLDIMKNTETKPIFEASIPSIDFYSQIE